MRYKRGHKSRDLIDARGRSGRRGGGGLGGLGGLGGGLGRRRGGAGMPAGGGLPVGKGCGGGGLGMLLLVGVLFLMLRGCGGGGSGGFGGVDLENGGGFGGIGETAFDQTPAGEVALDDYDPATDPDSELRDFMGFLIDDINDFWETTMAENNIDYARPKLVVFDGFTESACGGADARMGPHYCTLDDQIYLDFGFFQQLAGPQFEAGGDFAQAYVIAHEVAHHLQNQLGINAQVQEASRENPANRNELSIRMELQADCLAGVWAHSADQRGMLEPGDVEEGLRAAAAVGDDRIQEQAQGRISPEGWTHGSSADRQEWLVRGLRDGDTNECDTFSVEERFGG